MEAVEYAIPMTLSLNDDFQSPADGADLTVLGVGYTAEDGLE
jgi:hypothetical protein